MGSLRDRLSSVRASLWFAFACCICIPSLARVTCSDTALPTHARRNAFSIADAALATSHRRCSRSWRLVPSSPTGTTLTAVTRVSRFVSSISHDTALTRDTQTPRASTSSAHPSVPGARARTSATRRPRQTTSSTPCWIAPASIPATMPVILLNARSVPRSPPRTTAPSRVPVVTCRSVSAAGAAAAPATTVVPPTLAQTPVRRAVVAAVVRLVSRPSRYVPRLLYPGGRPADTRLCRATLATRSQTVARSASTPSRA